MSNYLTTQNSLNLSQKLKKGIAKRLPILEWLPNYTKDKLISDLVAGITVGLTLVPQSMAYSGIAGLQPEFGLYSSYLGVILYVFLGTCKQAAIGPTAIMAILTFQTCGPDYPSCVVLTGFYAGCFELLMAFFRLGWIVNFIPESVVIGFTSGAAVTIMSSQVKNLLGISGGKGSGFLGIWKSVFKDIDSISLGDSVVGLGAFAVLLMLRELNNIAKKRKLGPNLSKACWLLSISRNAIVVIATALVAYIWTNPPFKLTGHVDPGFPPIKPPDFLLPARNLNDSTPLEYLSFSESWSVLGAGPLIIALISVLQNVCVLKAFGAGQRVDAGQEMLALGVASLASSFVSSLPISGAFSRSAVNQASGVQSQMSGMFTGILVLLSLGVLTPSFKYIPKASLAAVIMCAVIFMVECSTLRTMFKIKRTDFYICIITFFSAILLGLELGILLGVAVSVLQLLFKSMKPSLNCKVSNDPETSLNYLILTPNSTLSSSLTFQGVDHLRCGLLKLLRQKEEISLVIIDFRNWESFDYTAVIGMATLPKNVGLPIRFMGCNENWKNALESAGMILMKVIVDENEIVQVLKKIQNGIACKDREVDNSVPLIDMGKNVVEK